MSKVFNVGVVGAAKIARDHVIPALKSLDSVKFWGVASRNIKTAEEFARKAGGGEAFEGYEALLNSPDVDIIYNPLPNDLHVPLTIKALEAGKHVICEKPLALNANEALKLLEAKNKHPELKVMEAFMYRFHPQWQQVLDWVDMGSIGEIRSISSNFCYCNHDPANIRNNPEAGGGALMDIGCYGISATRMLMGVEPKSIVATADMHAEFGVDNMMHLLMTFENKASATVVVSTKSQRSQALTVEGTKGRIVMTHPFYCDEDDERLIRLETDDSDQELVFGGDINHYQLMVEAFVQSIRDDSAVPLSLEDSIANMTVIDAAFESVKRAGWVNVA